jgi:hypothetical protein
MKSTKSGSGAVAKKMTPSQMLEAENKKLEEKLKAV